ncbi:unnamed protein product, partial [Symbiodinium sp. CCMP2592]
MIEFLSHEMQRAKFNMWLDEWRDCVTEDILESNIPCTSAIVYHWCQHGFEGFGQSRGATDYLYPKGLDFSLTKH